MNPTLSFIDGINVCGYIRGEIGLGSATRAYIAALESLGIPLALNDVPKSFVPHPDNPAFSGVTQTSNPYRVNLVVVPPHNHEVVAELMGPDYFRDRYNIGVWFWELGTLPEELHHVFQDYDEIWAGSTFIADALRPISTIPVVPLSPPLLPVTKGDRERGRAHIDAGDDTIFLFVFDFGSISERKNALASIDAFNAAFTRDDPARLIVKSQNMALDPDYFSRMQLRADSGNVTLFNGSWGSTDIQDLMAACDVYVSLHRSEGMGLTLLEAMSLGKPVIATGWSGNMDFMSTSNSYPVQYRFVPLARDFLPYRAGQQWAEPSNEHAAELMRYVFEHRAEAARVGMRASADIARNHSPATVAERIAARLTDIEDRFRQGWRPSNEVNRPNDLSIQESSGHEDVVANPVSMIRPEFERLVLSPANANVLDDRQLILAATDVGAIWTDARDESVGHLLRTVGANEPEEGVFIRGQLRPGMRVVDVGANIGYFTRMMADAVGPTGHVVALEPEPHNYATLRKNLAHAGASNVTALRCAAGASRAQLRLTITPTLHGGHYLAAQGPADESHVEVEVIPLDDLLDPTAAVDFVKIDIEGFDHLAVAGLQETLHRHKPLVFVEFYPGAIRRAGYDPSDVLRSYREMGLEVAHEHAPDRPLSGDDAVFTAIVESGALYGYTQAHTNLILRPAKSKPEPIVLAPGMSWVPESVWRPLLQRATAAFEQNCGDEGRAACLALLSAQHMPQGVRELVYWIQAEHARSLIEMFPGATADELTWPASNGTTLLDPSPVWFGDRLLALVRASDDNWQRDMLLTLGPGNKAIESVPLRDETGFADRFTDIRPFVMDDALHAAFLLDDPDDEHHTRAGIANIHDGAYANPRCIGPRAGHFQQGWAPLETSNGTRFLGWWEPTQMFRLNRDRTQLLSEAVRLAPRVAERFWSGSQGVRVPGGSLLLVNETIEFPNGQEETLNRFALINAPCYLSAISHQFFIDTPGDMATGLARRGNLLIAGFNSAERGPVIVKLDLNEVLGSLFPITIPGQT
jgi:FkbM family methyltransferase